MAQPAQKKRELLTAVGARLEEELHQRQQQLVDEATRNAVARARIAVLGALSEARASLQQMAVATMAARGAAGARGVPEAGLAAARASLQRLDELIAAARRAALAAPTQAMHGARASSSAAGAGLGAAHGAGASGAHASVAAEAAAGIGALTGHDATQLGCATPASDMCRQVAAACCLDLSQEEFITWWRSRITELSILQQQVQCGLSTERQLEQMVLEMGTVFGGLFLSRPWFSQVVALDMSTGLPTAPPPGWWENIARAIAPTPLQAPLLATCWKWVSTNHAALRAECESLARRAAEARPDLELHAALAEGLERVQLEYRVMTGAAKGVCMAAILRPDQIVTLYVMAWPHMPMLAAVLAALQGAGAAAPGGDGAPSGTGASSGTRVPSDGGAASASASSGAGSSGQWATEGRAGS